MKKIYISCLLTISVSLSIYAKSEYMDGSKPAEIRTKKDLTVDRSKLIMPETKTKPAPVESVQEPKKAAKFVVVYESTVGGETSEIDTIPQCGSTVVQQQVMTANGPAYVPVQVPLRHNNHKRTMRSKSTYRIISRE